MKYFAIAAVLSLPFLAACGGGASTVGTAPKSSITSLSPSSEAQSDALLEPMPLYTPNTADLLYVGNTGNNTITVYRHDEQGNTAPRKVIAGSKTGIDGPGQLSEDAQGNLYVANAGQSGKPNVLVFAHGASGNVAPTRKLNLPTGFIRLEAMTVDQKTGKIFVFADKGNTEESGNVQLLRFPPNASGDTAPFASGIVSFAAVAIASDSTGNNVIEAHSPNSPSDVGIGIETLVKQFPNTATVPTVYDTSWFGAGGIADDSATKTYLATARLGIYRLAEQTVGSGPDSPSGQTFAPPPVSIITSETCGGQLALGYLRNIYVVHSKPSCPADAVYVYTHDASGDAAPLRILTGPVTKLDVPFGIYEGQ